MRKLILEKIKELESQCWDDISPEWAENYKFVFNIEKFSRLVAEECAKVCLSVTNEGQPLHLVSMGYAQKIRDHFEIKS